MVADELLAPGSQVGIEPATWRDLNSLRRLEQICFPKDAWPLLDLVGVLTFPNIVRLRAVFDGQMIGFIAGEVRPAERLAWIATIGVLPEHRRRGVATMLLRACEARLDVPQVKLNVRLSNQSAIRLYEREGYWRAGAWPRYYADGEDALIMEKAL